MSMKKKDSGNAMPYDLTITIYLPKRIHFFSLRVIQTQTNAADPELGLCY